MPHTPVAEVGALAQARRFGWLSPRGAFWIGGALLAAALIAFGVLLFQPSGQVGSALLPVGQTAPAFTLTDVAGQPINLTAYRGHPVLINFWATTCQPCQTETPFLQRTFLADKAQGLMILGVSQADPADSVAQFGANYGLTYPLLPDPLLHVGQKYQVTSLPASYFVDKQGIIRYTVNGILKTDTLAAGLRAIGVTG